MKTQPPSLSITRPAASRVAVYVAATSTIAIGVVLLAAGLAGGGLVDAVPGPRLHWPDLALLAAQSTAIHLHLAGALVALGVGIVLLIGVKGTGRHRVLGWGWVIAMAVTAVSSLFIRGLNDGNFSLIHLLSGWTIIGLPLAVYAVRRGRVQVHAKAMTSMFTGGLIIAGLITFLPGRLMWRVFF